MIKLRLFKKNRFFFYLAYPAVYDPAYPDILTLYSISCLFCFFSLPLCLGGKIRRQACAWAGTTPVNSRSLSQFRLVFCADTEFAIAHPARTPFVQIFEGLIFPSVKGRALFLPKPK